eukprot:Pgem_evm1s1325
MDKNISNEEKKKITSAQFFKELNIKQLIDFLKPLREISDERQRALIMLQKPVKPQRK